MKRLRRTMMYVPGNNPGMVQNAGIYGADSIIFDLEDAVALAEKDGARYLVKYALMTIDCGRSEKVVRINGLDTPFCREDLEEIIPCLPDALRIPKIEYKEQVMEIDRMVSEIERKHGIAEGTVKLMPIMETALGVVNAFSIASSSKRIAAISIGGEDFTADLGIKRTKEGDELNYSRSQIVVAARAAGVDPIDTVFSDVNDEEGLKKSAKKIKNMGFLGQSVINPRQIIPIHEVFTPSDDEIEKARRIIHAMEEAEEHGAGVVSLDGKMIDAPVLKRAEQTIAYAKAVGKI